MKWLRAPAPAGPPAAEGEVNPDDVAPSAWSRFREVAWHMPRMLSGLGPLGPRGPEDGPPVLVIPGFFGTDRTTMDLRRALARAGWRAHPWLLGINSGAKKNTLNLLCRRLADLEDPRKVLVVGWSLGGMFARQLAHKCPDKVRAVITLASPFSGDLKTNTNVREIYERVAGHDVNRPPFPVNNDKPPVPTLALWGRRDGIVAPSAARGLATEVDKAVEIDTNHMGFAVYRPALSRVVAEIGIFLTEMEGNAPELHPMAEASPKAPARVLKGAPESQP
ncbi:alpha/beta fold hydrolase [Sphingomonas alba]|uniref:Alpha/beta hydrolase n=1 Tax=Sphingomonas alba TaxID=2908208 RepID=A0ABT0RN18_9SPHN|nr:alpha/beta fold hydrolase [Sphingomonas alba]MCL6683953.1 alpha/beta hydrolase [Sphingomonas alba]